MQRALPIVGGFLMAPVSAFGLIWQQSFVWIVCPQALVVMFLRQAQRPYDSVGAADYPDLAVGVLYYPIVGWILSHAIKRGTLRHTAIRVTIWHIVSAIMALAAVAVRNRLWAV
jgi:hypothetical protein